MFSTPFYSERAPIKSPVVVHGTDADFTLDSSLWSEACQIWDLKYVRYCSLLKSSLSANSCCQCDEKDATPCETGFVWIEEERNKSPNLQNKDSGCFQCFKGRMNSKAWF
jgi:hypothetical protein